MNHLVKKAIILFSEYIWIYYLIALFTYVEWKEVYFVDITWLLAATMIAYVLTFILAGRVHYGILIVINMIAIAIITAFNWRYTIESESIFFGMIFSIVVVFFYLRSAFFVFKQPSRLAMLYHFEGNIVLYALLAFLFSNNEWLHLNFIIAIITSLFGMVFTLYHSEEERKNIVVKKVGSSGWFSAVIGLFVIIVSLSSFLLFLPSLRQLLKTIGESGARGLFWLGKSIVAMISWVFQSFPKQDTPSPVELEAHTPIQVEEMPEETIQALPTEWLIIFIIVAVTIAIVIIIWLTARILKRWKRPHVTHIDRAFEFEITFWKQLLRSLRIFFERLALQYRKPFARYYKEKIYWHYYKLERWAKKQGITRGKSETVKEFVEKVIEYLYENRELCEDVKLKLAVGLRELCREYEAKYYGNEIVESKQKYENVLNSLQQMN